MELQKSKNEPTVLPLEQRSWNEIGKWFAVHVGRWAVIGTFLGTSLYVAGSRVVDDSKHIVSNPVAEQGAILNATLETNITDNPTLDKLEKTANDVDDKISSISGDWDELKTILRENGIDLDKEPDQDADEFAPMLPPNTLPPVVDFEG